MDFNQAANFFTTYSFVFVVGYIFVTYARLVPKSTTKILSNPSFCSDLSMQMLRSEASPRQTRWGRARK